MFKDQTGRWIRGPLIPFSAFFRILKAGEKRATDLLKEKEGELHRVSNLSSLLLPVDFLMFHLQPFDAP